MRKALLIPVLLAVAAPVLARDAGVPEAIAIGKPLDCLPIRSIRQSNVRSDAVIDFVAGGGKVYRNTLPQGGCPQLGFERRFSYRTSISQLCSVDTITVLVNGPGNLTSGATCGLGKFQPVKLASGR